MIAPVALSAPGAALISAGTAAIVSLLGVVIAGIRQERQRRREFYARALEAVYAYREFAYAIPRRDHTRRDAERVRISEALREVQRDLAHAEALMHVERGRGVHAHYRQLVAQTRKTAGDYMRDAWKTDPITSDPEMNIPVGLDFSAIEPFEQEYLDAVTKDLAWWKWWR